MLAERLKSKRVERGLTQEDLAHLAGVRVRTVSKCETGGTSPLADTVHRLARALGCTTDFLLGADIDHRAAVDG